MALEAFNYQNEKPRHEIIKERKTEILQAGGTKEIYKIMQQAEEDQKKDELEYKDMYNEVIETGITTIISKIGNAPEAAGWSDERKAMANRQLGKIKQLIEIKKREVENEMIYKQNLINIKYY